MLVVLFPPQMYCHRGVLIGSFDIPGSRGILIAVYKYLEKMSATNEIINNKAVPIRVL
jgi:hypothetical protein